MLTSLLLLNTEGNNLPIDAILLIIASKTNADHADDVTVAFSNERMPVRRASMRWDNFVIEMPFLTAEGPHTFKSPCQSS